MSGSSTSGRRTLRIMTNMRGLMTSSNSETPIEWFGGPGLRGGGLGKGLRAARQAFSCDYVLVDGLSTDFLLLLLLKRLLPFSSTRFVLLNLLTVTPRRATQRIRFAILAWLLRGTWKILQYHRDTRALQAALGLKADRFGYIPFKINMIEIVLNTPTSDQGYIFCGGKTRRDFDTLLSAVSSLPFPVKIVTTSNDDIAKHGSFLSETLQPPPNVEVLRLDGSFPPFVELVAASRVVVLPIKPDLCGVGIGVYIMAMALRKPVVISEGPSTTEDLTEDLALVVPPSDPAALREALRRAFTDDALRSRLSENGFKYATSLGGEERLLASITQWLQRDWAGSRVA